MQVDAALFVPCQEVFVPLRLHIKPGDELPIYRQIMRGVVDAIAGGNLAPGEQLPSHRDLAETLVVAPLTVKKAYDELARDGYVDMRHGAGTFVREMPALALRDKLGRLRPTARKLVGEATVLGVSLERVVRLVEEEDAELRKSRDR
jgi:GntR family transcriptional regulator